MGFDAKLRSIRITPRKMGVIADEVRGKSVNEAFRYLSFSPRKRTATIILRVLENAVANARNAQVGIEKDKLFIKKILVGPSTTLKRMLPRAKGSGSTLLKRTSNLYILLAEAQERNK